MGATGTAGQSGNLIYSDTVSPIPSLGVPGDLYLDISRGDLYQHNLNTIIVSTFAGSTAFGSSGTTISNLLMYIPGAITKDTNGNIFIADTFNGIIRKIDSLGNVSSSARIFIFPSGIAIHPNGDIYVADFSSNRISKVNSSFNNETILDWIFKAKVVLLFLTSSEKLID